MERVAIAAASLLVIVVVSGASVEAVIAPPRRAGLSERVPNASHYIRFARTS